MTRPIRRLDLGALRPVRSQAIYHGLAEAMEAGSPDTLILCRPASPYLCVGYHQAAELVLDLDRCRQAGWPVLRRKIGGGAVYLDRTQLFYQAIVHRSRAPAAVRDVFRQLLGPVVLALRRLGLEATLAGVNEIEVGGRRIAGTGGGVLGEAVVVVGNLLFDFPARRLSRVWRTPSPAFRRLAAGGLRRYLTTLSAELGRRCRHVPPMATVADLIAACYAERLARPVVPGSLDQREVAAVERAEAELHSRAFALGGARRSRGGLKIARGVSVWEMTVPAAPGSVRLAVRLREGTIDAIAPAEPGTARWAGRLAGAPLERQALAARLNRSDRSDRTAGPELIETLLALGHRAHEIG